MDGVDDDDDGFASLASGGSDCDDDDDSIYPLASDSVGNGIDENCDLLDGVDDDGDGFASLGSVEMIVMMPMDLHIHLQMSFLALLTSTAMVLRVMMIIVMA